MRLIRTDPVWCSEYLSPCECKLGTVSPKVVEWKDEQVGVWICDNVRANNVFDAWLDAIETHLDEVYRTRKTFVAECRKCHKELVRPIAVRGCVGCPWVYCFRSDVHKARQQFGVERWGLAGWKGSYLADVLFCSRECVIAGSYPHFNNQCSECGKVCIAKRGVDLTAAALECPEMWLRKFCSVECCSLALDRVLTREREQRLSKEKLQCVQKVRKSLTKVRKSLSQGLDPEALRLLKQEFEQAATLL